MKLFILALLLLTACKDECKDPNRPWNMFDYCNTSRPAKPAKTITSEWEKKASKGCNHAIPGRFRVIDKRSSYYKCTGVVTHYPILSDDLIWEYHFNRLRCGKNWYDSERPFDESELKRIGNWED